ncbi:RNA 2',3'-cyclic phosphodiesterase [Pseudomonas sp. N040]|uniref:RNA 2',3'-cyclic phosphodiesterase n=1 Tax=Pseudomonas sp. N040 TaxID=2785325 RepID=UPI001E6220E2|nr:RNA 2',3'-cyclic phosphodiesterase [Pseudomonas sp. N040]
MRLFFALACPATIAARISEWRNTLGIDGTPVPAANLHVTLAFLGTQPCARLPELIELAAAIETPAFTLALDRLQRWSGGVLLLAPSQPPQALLALAERLRTELLALGIASEPHEYLPHLTLARHCRAAVAGMPPTFAWQAGEFGLFTSESAPAGVRYRPLASWPLFKNS